MTHSSHIHPKLKDTKDPNCRSVIAMRFLDEYYGNAAPSINITGHVRSFLKDNKNLAVAKVVQQSEVSTENLVKCLELKATKPAFIAFCNFVDDTCLNALDAMYGSFSAFTSPILSQRQLSAISDMFKTTLPRYYHALSAVLNKSTKSNVTRFENLQG